MGRRRRCRWVQAVRRRGAGALLAVMLAAAFAGPAAAAKIGVTSAVNPEAEGLPPGAERRVLHVGIDMQANETVTTSANGQAQLLFLDGSAMSIGPSSEVVLDRFVYDPASGEGELAVTVGRGLFRFVGGRISKGSEVRIRTPAATMGIRGGIATFSVGPDGAVESSFLFGELLTVTSAGQSQSTGIPGTGIQVLPGRPPEPARFLTAAEVTATLSIFQAPPPGALGEASGAADTTGEAPQPDAALQRSGVAGAASDAVPEAAPPTPDAAAQAAVQTASSVDFDGTDDQATDDAAARSVAVVTPAPAPPAEPPAAEDPAGGGGAGAGPDAGDGGGDALSPVTGGAIDGRLFREPVLAGFDPQDLSATLLPGNSPGLAGTAIADAALTVTTGAGETYRFPYLPGGADYAISSGSSVGPLEDFAGWMFVAGDGGFWRAGGVGTGGGAAGSEEFLLFGGTPTALAGIPTQGSAALATGGLLELLPFTGGAAAFGSASPGTARSPFYLRYGPGIAFAERSAGATPPVGFQVSVTIDGSGAAQRSFLAGAIATFVEEGAPGSGRPALSGSLFGSRRDSAAAAPVALRSALASADAGARSAIYGESGQYMVLDPSSLSLDRQSGTVSRGSSAMLVDPLPAAGEAEGEWFALVAQPGGAVPAGYPAARSSRVMRGFTGGIGAAGTAAGDETAFAFVSSRGRIAPGGVLVQTDAAANGVSAEMEIARLDESGLRVLYFGGAPGAFDTAPASAFIDNGRYIAREAPGRTALTGEGQEAVAQGLAMVTGASIDPARLWPEGATCRCEYLDWGFWSGALTLPGGAEERYHLASWVAGELPELSEIPASGTASYGGRIVGGVLDGGSAYIAQGAMGLNWDFGARNGSFQVGGFDGADYGGTLGTTDGRQVLGSGLSAATGRTMDINGTFFSGGGDPVAAMGGSFTVENAAGSYSGAGTWTLDRNP